MDYIATYLMSLKLTGEYSKNTVQAYSSDLKRFLQFLEERTGGKPLIDDFSSVAIKEFLETENEAGFSASTLHRRKVVLSQFSQYLTKTFAFSREDYLEVLAWKQKLWKEIYKREVKYLSDRDLGKLFDVMEGEKSTKAIRDAAIFSILLETGLSVGKLISIDLSDLDLGNERVMVIMNGVGHTYSIKNSANALHKYLALGRKEYTQSESEKALFISQMGGRISRQGVWQMVKDWGEKAKLTVPLSPRILRNTKINKMVHAELTTAEIQRELGHSNRHSTRTLIRKMNRKPLELERSK